MMRFLTIAVIVLSATALTPHVYAETNVHIVGRGESLGTIARHYNIPVSELIAKNGIVNPDYIYVGQRLVIPGLENTDTATQAPATKPLPSGDGYHVVGRGDTLSQIAKNNGLSLDDLMRLNGLTNSNFLWVGQKLRVTARVARVPVKQEGKPQLAGKIYVVKAGDTLATIAETNEMTLEQLMLVNGLPHEKFFWVGQRLRIYVKGMVTKPTLKVADAPADGRRWIEVNLSTQTLTAWQGDVAVLTTLISSGLPATPTVTGRFRIGTKYKSQRMVGPDYDLPGVPWVMYFYAGYAIHGAYWHTNFGSPMSHGCVNMDTDEAELLYDWAPAGTEVYVHH
ncbi:MAG: LysM peptidoglycan-binding domain-containing protein [Caldilineaceae bacterium]